ncbi:MAG: hypothetical protein GH148_10385 [Clostridia bacterium]|nr:hypothetical protein [Clostridia bacterium]
MKITEKRPTLKDMGYRPSEKFRDVLGKLFEMKLDAKSQAGKMKFTTYDIIRHVYILAMNNTF